MRAAPSRMTRRPPCVVALPQPQREHARPEARALLAALVATPQANTEAVAELATAHELCATPVPVGAGSTGSELVLLVPAAAAADVDEHWLLALWRDEQDQLCRAALFACADYWHAQTAGG
jgi:hypothetical protein